MKMTAKEKANILVRKFCNHRYMRLSLAKECALNCVDEVISALEEEKGDANHAYWWIDVRLELEKMDRFNLR